MNTKPLDLQGIADLLGVRFFRVRRWRDNSIHERGHRRLPRPDVADLKRNPLWSERVIVAWAGKEGLWPSGVDQYECAYCPELVSIYGPNNRVLRPHGWRDGGDGKLWPCEGSYKAPRVRVIDQMTEVERVGA